MSKLWNKVKVCPKLWKGVNICSLFWNWVNACPYTLIWFGLVWFMVLKTAFNNISVISWRSVLLVEETRVPGENHRPIASYWQSLSHNVVSSTLRQSRVQTHKVIGDCTDCTGSYKSNYHTITTMTAPGVKVCSICI